MDNKKIESGMGLCEVLQVVFIVLKLCGVIDWRWVVVLIPLWIDLGLIALMLAGVLITAYFTVKSEKKDK